MADNTKHTDEQLVQLSAEVERGKKASKAYDLFLKDYIASKREQLFQAFKDVPLTDPQTLLDIKRLDLAWIAVENEIVSIMETARLASISLNVDEIED
jgi:hypothetical protein